MAKRGHSVTIEPMQSADLNLLRRMPVVSGIFYPDAEEALKECLESWGLKEGSTRTSLSKQTPGGRVLIAPHGAWDLSGEIAAAAFASLQAELGEGKRQGGLHDVQRVILIGPCHSYWHGWEHGESGVYLSESSSFQTPIGDLTVDRRTNRTMTSSSTLVQENDIFHLSEHSIEVLLPMVKFCMPSVKIIPILVQDSSPPVVAALARVLRMLANDNIEHSIIIVSSNISASCDKAQALTMAENFSVVLPATDADAFSAELSAGRINACGGAIISALFESGLLAGKRFSAISPLSTATDEDGYIVYYRAFVAR